MDGLDNSFNEKPGVLFVDDEELTLKYFERAYSPYFKIYTANNISAAEDILESHGDNIAILITDKRMPKGSGLELIADVKSKKPEIVRLLTTGFHDADDAIQAINEGEIFRYISKPWDIDKLRYELMEAIKIYELKRGAAKEKITLRSNSAFLLAHITNELESPLHNLSVTLQLLKKKLPQLLENFDEISLLGEFSAIPRREMEKLKALPSGMELYLKEIHSFMDVILANVTSVSGEMLELNVHSVFDCLIESLQLYPVNENYARRIHLLAEENFYFKGSDELLILVMFNLLRNAVYSLEEAKKGDIVIRLSHGKEYNHIHVRDTGLGINDSIKPFIFDEYFTTKSPYGGLGLGLSFCKKALISMNGDIRCETMEGEYCEFIISLPKLPESYRKVHIEIETEHLH